MTAQEVVKPTEATIDLAERAIEEWLATHDGEEIDCRALARLAVMQGEVGGLREAPTINGNAMPERIWLTDEGSGDICWANEPDPTGDGEAEAVEYIRADAALAASPPVDQGRIERLLELRVREFGDKHGPSGAAWNISSMLDLIRAALTNKGVNP